jgi:transcriptional regulator with XRE-family HTH domain
MKDERKALGSRLREAREYLGLSQDEVAKAVDLPRSAISLIESGQRRIDALELKRFAEVYQRPVTDFTGGVDAKPATPATIQHLARAVAKLTESDQAELLRFAEFLGTKSERTAEG